MVTGANSGIGAGITQRFLELGLTVVGVDHKIDNLQKICETGKWNNKLHPINVEMTRDEEVLRAFQWIEENLPGVDILVNCAGVGGRTSLLDGGPTEWRRMLDVNVVSLCLCTREAVRSMTNRKVSEGHIIHISSNHAHFVPEFAPFHFYSATKHAVRALTEGLRMELNEVCVPIRITSISPGLVRSEIIKSSLGEDYDKLIFDKNPSMLSEDIASAVEYALSTPSHVQVHDVTIKPRGSAR